MQENRFGGSTTEICPKNVEIDIDHQTDKQKGSIPISKISYINITQPHLHKGTLT